MTLPASQQRPEAKIRVSRGLFAEAFRNVLYTPEGSAQAPKLIHQLVNGDDRGIAETALAGRTVLGGERLGGGIFPVGDLHRRRPVPVEGCRRDGRRNVRRQLSPRAATRGLQGMAAWRRVERASPATKSAIPTLLLSGEFDPVTPPSGAEEVLRGLSKGRHVVIRNNGHPIGNAEACIGKMIGQFLDRASVDGRRSKLRRRQSPRPVPHFRKKQ